MRVYKRKHKSALQDELPSQMDYDDVIVGSGAGGGHLAYKLSQTGRRILIIEAGKLSLSREFSDDELKSYQNLYQEQLSRTSSDKKIKILQGKAVGGSTTVNWTSSFRTPKSTLAHWRDEYDIKLDLDKHFEAVEKLYGIKKWDGPINENNRLLKEVCEKNDWSSDIIPRNVNACANTGLCGLGCPVNAKQSSLVNSIPKALKENVELISELSVEKLNYSNNKIISLIAKNANNKVFTIKAKRFFLSAGSIGTPAIMLRSELKDPYKLIGKRTFLHPTLMSAYFSDKVVEGAKGAPQTVYSNHFLEGDREHMGFKLEVAPIHPVLYATVFDTYGKEHFNYMQERPHVSAQILLLRDGLHPESQGGEVFINEYGLPQLKYDQNNFFKKSALRALKILSAGQLNAGAKGVYPGFYFSKLVSNHNELNELFSAKENQIKVFSAHVMGGAPMGVDEKRSVVNMKAQSHYYENLYVMDGSVLPTSLGANPMETIYGLVDYFLTD